jgi:protein TonB
MLVERRRLRPRAFGPLALALSVHGLALALAAVLGIAIPARLVDAREKLVIGLTQRPEEPPELAPLRAPDEPEFSPSDDIPAFDQTPEPLPFDPVAFDLSLLPPESIVESAPLPLEPRDEIAPGAAALGLLTPRIAVKTGPGGAAPATQIVQGSGGGLGGDPTRSGTAENGISNGTALSIVAAAPRPPVVREPALLAAPPPGYPRLSRRAGEEGSVLCRLHVSARGKVTAVDVVESSGFERLDEAARTTLLGWSFEPRKQDGASVASTLLHRVTFRLEG